MKPFRLPNNSTVLEKLTAYASLDENTGCLLWQGTLTRNGYGQLGTGKGERRAHRLAYIEHTGPIPRGLFVLHHCDTPACINPNHLFLGTNQDNMDDKVAKGRQAKGSDNGRSKLSEEDVLCIAEKLKQGVFQADIACQYGVTAASISLINLGTNWPHVTGASHSNPITRQEA